MAYEAVVGGGAQRGSGIRVARSREECWPLLRRGGEWLVTEEYLIIAKVIAQAWQDEEYKKRLLAHPVEVLREAGLNVPEGIRRQSDRGHPNAQAHCHPRETYGLSAEELEEYPDLYSVYNW